MSPAYGVLTNPSALYPGDIGLAFNAEAPVINELSQQFAIPRYQGQSQTSLSVEFVFSAIPGTFQFQVWEADTDTPNDYIEVSAGGAVTTVNGNNVARIDLAPFLGSFIAIACIAATQNVCNLTCKITRKS